MDLPYLRRGQYHLPRLLYKLRRGSGIAQNAAITQPGGGSRQ
jgi:hypothetical protein